MNKLRFKILKKIAQASPPANLPTEEVTKTKTVSGSPQSFIATDYYPTITMGFGSNNANIINYLTYILNNGLYYTSDGQVSLKLMHSNNFSVGTTSVPSEDLKNLMNFVKQVYSELFNRGTEFKQKLTSEEINERISRLKSSNFLNNLSSTNPMGQLSNKIGGNIKTLINNYLLQIK